LEKMWMDELVDLEKQYAIYKKKRIEIQAGSTTSSDKKKKLLVKK